MSFLSSLLPGNSGESQIYEEYKAGAQSLNASGGEFNACRCSHHLLQTLQSADKGDFGPDFMGCLKNDTSLRAFAKYMAGRM